MSKTTRDMSDCETCVDAVNVTTYLDALTGMWMCAECRDKQAAVTSTQTVIADSRKIDSAIELKKDVWNAATVSFVTLQAAIQNNPSIPDDQKRYKMAEECALRIQKLDAAIFADEAALNDKRNERHALLKNTQDLVATLRAEQRAKLPQYDVTYKPTSPTKKVKSTQPAKSGKSFDKAAVYAAAKKYDIPAHSIQMLVTSRAGISIDSAAREIAGILGKL